MFIVTLKLHGATSFLRGTVWTPASERATRYATRELAEAARLAAKQFMVGRARLWATSEVEEVLVDG